MAVRQRAAEFDDGGAVVGQLLPDRHRFAELGLRVRRLARAASEALDTPSVRERLEAIGVTVVAPERRSPEYLEKFIVSEIEKWAVPIKASGIRAE